MSGGAVVYAGIGEQHDFTITGPFVAGDTISVTFIDNLSGLLAQAGAGSVTGTMPTFVFTYGDKVYLLSGPTVYFSALTAPTVYNDPSAVGNGNVTMTNFFSTPEDLQAVTVFQGKLAFFTRSTTQIWSTPADPAAWQQQQVLQNIGTVAPLSVQSLGELDVFFLSDSGVRTLRARETSLNAFVTDVGSPIDSIVQGVLAGLTDAQKAVACGIVEPSSNRYWLFLKDTIYVLSYFPGSKIVAWSTYEATYNNGGVQTAFVPEKFVLFNGQVFCRAGDSLYRYGGTDGNTYDNCVATVELPWLDIKTPGTRKSAEAIDVAMTNSWAISAGMDPVSGILKQVFNGTMPSFDSGRIPYSSQGTHLKLKAVTTGATAAKLSSLLIKYQEADVR